MNQIASNFMSASSDSGPMTVAEAARDILDSIGNIIKIYSTSTDLEIAAKVGVFTCNEIEHYDSNVASRSSEKLKRQPDIRD